MRRDPIAIIKEAHSKGIILEDRGDKLAILSPSGCPEEFKKILSENKKEILRVLVTAKRKHLMKQAWCGEFDDFQP